MLIFSPVEKGNFIAMRVRSLVPGLYPYLSLWKEKELINSGNRAQSPGLGGKVGQIFPGGCMWGLASSCAGWGCKCLIISLEPGMSSKPTWHKTWHWYSISFPFHSRDKWDWIDSWAYPVCLWNRMGLSLASMWQVVRATSEHYFSLVSLVRTWNRLICLVQIWFSKVLNIY